MFRLGTDDGMVIAIKPIIDERYAMLQARKGNHEKIQSRDTRARETSGAKLQMVRRILLSGLLPALLCGCATVENNTGVFGERKPYGGVLGDYAALVGPTEGHAYFPPPLKVIFILDMPFSLVGDTLMLPFNLYHQHRIKADQEALRLENDRLVP